MFRQVSLESGEGLTGGAAAAGAAGAAAPAGKRKGRFNIVAEEEREAGKVCWLPLGADLMWTAKL